MFLSQELSPAIWQYRRNLASSYKTVMRFPPRTGEHSIKAPNWPNQCLVQQRSHSSGAKQVKETCSPLLHVLAFLFPTYKPGFEGTQYPLSPSLQCQREQVSNWGWGLDGSIKTTDLQLAAMINSCCHLCVITLMWNLSFWNLPRQLYQNIHEKQGFFASYKLLWKKSAV